jgi:hypothetical protein
MKHIVHHIEDMRESLETENRYAELKEPTSDIIHDAADIFKKFFCAQVDNWANDLNFKDDSADI